MSAPVISDSMESISCLRREDRKSLLVSLLYEFPGRSAKRQRLRMLVALQRIGHLTTFEATRYLDCYSATKRLSEIRESGWQIETVMVWAKTEQGEEHLIGMYILSSANDSTSLDEEQDQDTAGTDESKETAHALIQQP